MSAKTEPSDILPAWSRALPAVLLGLVVALRAPSIGNPLFGLHNFRMNESAAMARNFHELGMNPLYPRIDWGGAGPGFIEEACQIYTYLVAVLYRVFGVHEELGQGLTLVCFTAAGYVFYRMLLRLFPRPAALLALFFYAIAPLGIYYGRTFQPDSLGLLLTLSSVHLFLVWTEDDRKSAFVGSMVLVALASLTKPPNLYVGLPILYLAHRRFGWALFKELRLWVYAAVTIVPTVLWFLHAHQFWIEYGNTAGIWGQGFSKFGLPDFRIGAVGRRIVLRAATLPGFVLLLVGLVSRPPRRNHLMTVWLLAHTILFFLTYGAQAPHDYYQLPLVPTMAALAGWGAHRIWTLPWLETRPPLLRRAAQLAVLGLCAAAVVNARWSFRNNYQVPLGTKAQMDFAERVRTLTPPDALVIVGGLVYARVDEATLRRREPDGIKCGTDPVELYQSHRKGWFVHTHRLDLDMLLNLEAKGARYFITNRIPELDSFPEFRRDLAAHSVPVEVTKDWEIHELRD